MNLLHCKPFRVLTSRNARIQHSAKIVENYLLLLAANGLGSVGGFMHSEMPPAYHPVHFQPELSLSLPLQITYYEKTIQHPCF